MKKIFLLTAFLGALLAGTAANAQVSVNINVGGPQVYQQPAYNDDCDYYYMPEIGAYYNVTRRLYVYNDCGRWISASYLPSRWRGYNWNRGVRIYGRTPYLRHDEYRRRYAGWNGRGGNWDRGNYGGGYAGGHRGRGYNQGGYNNGNYGHNNGGNWNNNNNNNGGNWNNGNNNNGGNWNHGRNNGGGNWNNNGNNGNNGNWNGGNGGQQNNGGGNWRDRR